MLSHESETSLAARAGFEPAVGRLTAACVSASPPGNASRRAQPRRARCATPARPFEFSKIRARRSARAPGPSPRVVSSRVPLRGLRSVVELDPSAQEAAAPPLSYETVSWTHVGPARVELAPFALMKARCAPLCGRPRLWIDHCRCFIRNTSLIHTLVVGLCGVEPPSQSAPPRTNLRPRNDESRSVSRAASIDFSMVLPP